MGKHASILETETLLEYFKVMNEEFGALFEKGTNPLGDMDTCLDIETDCPSDIKELLAFLPSAMAAPSGFTFDPNQWASTYLVMKMQEMLNAYSLKEYIRDSKEHLLHKTMVGEIRKKYCNAIPNPVFEEALVQLDKVINYDLFKKQIPVSQSLPLSDNELSQNYFLEKLSSVKKRIELRALLGLVDLCLLFTREIASVNEITYFAMKYPFLITKKDDAKKLAAYVRALLNQNTIDKKYSLKFLGATTQQPKSNLKLYALDLFESNNLLINLIRKYFKESVIQEPYLIYAMTTYAHKFPILSQTNNTTASIFSMLSENQIFKLRTDIRVRRAILLFRAYSSVPILHNKVERGHFESFLNENDFTDNGKTYLYENLKDYYPEVFSTD